MLPGRSETSGLPHSREGQGRAGRDGGRGNTGVLWEGRGWGGPGEPGLLDGSELCALRLGEGSV